jgi:hypothetical protein
LEVNWTICDKKILNGFIKVSIRYCWGNLKGKYKIVLFKVIQFYTVILFVTVSRAMTKPTKWVCDQHGSRPVCVSAQSDQDPCCSLSVSLLVIGFVREQHGSWSDCADAGWSGSMLVANALCWFCHGAAQVY